MAGNGVSSGWGVAQTGPTPYLHLWLVVLCTAKLPVIDQGLAWRRSLLRSEGLPPVRAWITDHSVVVGTA